MQCVQGRSSRTKCNLRKPRHRLVLIMIFSSLLYSNVSKIEFRKAYLKKLHNVATIRECKIRITLLQWNPRQKIDEIFILLLIKDTFIA